MLSRFSVETCEPRRLFAAPAVDAIPSYTVPVGKTIQIPVTTTSNAGKVTYSVRDSSDKVAGGYRVGNSYIQMDVAGYAQPMVFQLFDDTAPDTVRRIKGLINAKFYDGLTFHRILNNFVVQGGDPKGDGSGGPQSGSFDDEFDVNTYFTGTGQLAMANSGKDTNGSQFFITEGPQRLLDFNHTIFGQLVRGETTRQAISNVSVDANGSPANSVVITRVRLIQDSSDAVLVVRGTAAGTYTMKVTGTNADGSTSRNFSLTVTAPDTINDPPIFVNPKPVYYTTPGKAVTINLGSVDPEGTGQNFFFGQYVQQNDSTGQFTGTNQNVITITPANKTGAITLRIGVVGSQTDTTRGSTSADQSGFNIFDSQLVTIAVGDLPISASLNNFDATAGTATGEFLVGTIRDSDASGVPANFTAKIEWGDGTFSNGIIRKSRNGRLAVYANKTYGAKVSGEMPITMTVTGNNGALATATSTATVRTAAEVVNGTLILNGTSGDDKISVSRKSRNYVVTVNKKNFAFATNTVNLIQAFGLAGSDAITLSSLVYTNSNLDGGDGNDAISGGVGSNVINGGAGSDSILCGNGTSAIANRVGGADGNDTITGGTGRDRLFGGLGNDNIDGGGGRDIVNGDEGNDTVVGGASNDMVYGGAGNDILNGLSGADIVDGGAGNDTARDDELDTFISIKTLV